MKTVSVERRKNQRFKTRLPIKYKLLSPTDQTTQTQGIGFLVNSSKKGLCLLSNHELTNNEMIEIKIRFPFKNDIIMETLKGSVIWTQSAKHFTDIDRMISDYLFISGIIVRSESKILENFIDYWTTLHNLYNRK